MSDCKKLKDNGYDKSGIYEINLNDGNGVFKVFCDMNLQDGGWTIIQRRIDNTTSFNRNRDEYNVGFGSFNGNFWLGLENIRRITDTGTHELYIGLQSFTGGLVAFSRYGSFSLDTDANDYTLTVDNFDTESTAGNSLSVHSSHPFSTPDEDNDGTGVHCASDHSSGWWFRSGCREANLNGVYHYTGQQPASPATSDGIVWNAWEDEIPRKTVVMAIRPT